MTETHSGCCSGNNELLLARIKQIASQYKGKPGNLIQVLHMVQGVYGYLPVEVQRIVSTELEIPLSIVSGVVSFYSFFATEPRGKHTIRVCLGTACYVRGGVSLVDALTKKLGVEVGHTTSDGVFTFEVARCIGACGLAPAIQIDTTVYPYVKPDGLDEILEPWYHDEGETEGVQ
jgi:NADH:ubiquinone oxidoreductase subunit E